jgi:beta-xylosidase
MRALDEFDTTVTFCFTPEALGIEPHHTSAPREISKFAEFCAEMIRRYAPTSATENSTSTFSRTQIAANGELLQTSAQSATRAV